jgi:hypothetical protein
MDDAAVYGSEVGAMPGQALVTCATGHFAGPGALWPEGHRDPKR